MKRPLGISVLALLLGWLALGAFVLTLTAETLAELHVRWQLVRVGALVYGLTAAVAAAGLWKRRRWGYFGFLAWAAVVLTMVLWWPAVFPRPILPWWAAFLWVALMAAWLIPLAGYVRRTLAMVQPQDARPSARPHLPLELLPDTLAICRLEPGAPVPSWAVGPSPFLTLSRTAEELSITTLQGVVPAGVPCEREYRALRVRGPLPLDLIGIVAAIADPLAEAGLSIFAISTYDTDYVLVKAPELEDALRVLRRAGHQILTERL